MFIASVANTWAYHVCYYGLGNSFTKCFDVSRILATENYVFTCGFLTLYMHKILLTRNLLWGLLINGVEWLSIEKIDFQSFWMSLELYTYTHTHTGHLRSTIFPLFFGYSKSFCHYMAFTYLLVSYYWTAYRALFMYYMIMHSYKNCIKKNINQSIYLCDLSDEKP